MSTRLFFDLDDTLVTNVLDAIAKPFNPEMWMMDEERVDNIRGFLNQHQIRRADIFSYAIWDERDLKEFNLNVRPVIEHVYGFEVNEVWTMERVMQLIQQKRHLRYDDVSEFVALNTKQFAFLQFVMLECRDGVAVLIDDIVDNISLVNHDINLIVHLLNPAGSLQV